MPARQLYDMESTDLNGKKNGYDKRHIREGNRDGMVGRVRSEHISAPSNPQKVLSVYIYRTTIPHNADFGMRFMQFCYFHKKHEPIPVETPQMSHAGED